jgi:hypothetical protein
MRSAIVLLVLVGCGGEEDPCSVDGDGTAVDLHTTQVGAFLDPLDFDATAAVLQDGGPECPWVALAGTHTGHYPLALHHERYAVAVQCGATQHVLSRGVDDGADVAVECASGSANGGHTLRAHTANTTNGPFVIQTFVAGVPSLKAGLTNGDAFFQWHARSGVYDLVVLGHPGDADLEQPDNVRVVRGLAAATDPDVDITVTTSPEWVVLGPAVPVQVPPLSAVAMSYLTSNGTRVELGAVVATATTPASGALPTWPASVLAPGEVSIETFEVDSADALDRRRAIREIADVPPTVFDVQAPLPFAATFADGRFAFEPLDAATGYTFSCAADRHSFVLDVSPAWLGEDRTFALPAVPNVSFAACTMWDATAEGRDSPTDTWRTTHTLLAQ